MVILEIKDDGTLIYNGKVYAEIEKSAQSPASETKESIFAKMVANLDRKEDREKYPNSVFWLDKDGQFMFQHDEKNGIFWCSYAHVWSVFGAKFGMDYDEIQAFTKGMVEEHFKCKGVTTDYRMVCLWLRWRSILNARE